MPLSAALSPPSVSLFPQSQSPHQSNLHLPHNLSPFLKPKSFSPQFHYAHATRRNPKGGGGDSFVDDPRNWRRSINSEIDRPYGFDDDGDEDEDEDGDDEEDRNLDLLVRFVQNVFKKVSKQDRRAVGSVLPVAIPTKLVYIVYELVVFELEFSVRRRLDFYSEIVDVGGVSVNGVLMLAFLWMLKAFLEVICTLGSLVFVSILLIRGIWIGVAYVQVNRNHKVGNFEVESRPWTGAQPAA